MDQCCKCEKSENDTSDTKSSDTSTNPGMQHASTSTSGLHEFQQIGKSREEPKATPSHFTTYQDLDELMNIFFCETEESERLFMCQTEEILRRDSILTEHKKKVNELDALTQSTAAAVEKCEGNLFYINHTQGVMEHCISSLLELYMSDTRELPDDERGSLYKQMLGANVLREEAMRALEDLSEACMAQNEVNDSIIKLQILEILNYHYQVLCAVQFKMDTIKQTIEQIQECYKRFFEKYPYALLSVPYKYLLE